MNRYAKVFFVCAIVLLALGISGYILISASAQSEYNHLMNAARYPDALDLRAPEKIDIPKSYAGLEICTLLIGLSLICAALFYFSETRDWQFKSLPLWYRNFVTFRGWELDKFLNWVGHRKRNTAT